MSDIRLDTAELDRITAECGLNAVQVVNRLAFEVEGEAKMMAPVDTGALRNSGFTEPATQQNKTATVGFTMVYAPRIEFGFVGADSLGRNYNQAARPYLKPAVERMARKFNSGETWRELVK